MAEALDVMVVEKIRFDGQTFFAPAMYAAIIYEGTYF
jgi:hypothetical protein